MIRRVRVGALAALAACASLPSVELDSREIREASGLVVSRAHPGILWTHNDSGDRARLFALETSGAFVAEYAVTGAKAIDWEDLTSDGAGHLYVGDIGNNRSSRRELRVYRLLEPDPAKPARQIAVDRVLRFRYADQRAFPDPDLAFDAEALYFADGALWILTKHRRDSGTTLYRLADVAGEKEQVLEPVQRLALPVPTSPLGTVTAAAASADGRKVAVLLYTALFVFDRRADGALEPRPRAQIALDPFRTGQVEGIAWDGDALLFCNEPGQVFRIDDPLAPGLGRYPP